MKKEGETNMPEVKQKAEEFINNIPCRSKNPYPSTQISVKNEQVAELLLSAYAGGGNSELTALTQYFVHSQSMTDKEAADMNLCIAMDEMYHLQVIGEMIISLGGNLKFWAPNHAYWTGGYVSYGLTDTDKLSQNIFSEQEAIAGYQAILREVQYFNTNSNAGLNQVCTVIQRILEDENVHLSLFTDKYNQIKGK